MKQFEPIHVTVKNTQFHIFPFPAFKASNMCGELTALLGPIIGSIGAVLANNAEETDAEQTSLLDVDIEKSAPALAGAFSSISGDKVEAMLRKLLVTSKNVTVDYEDDTHYLTEDLANEIFCSEVDGMFVLAFHVIKANFSGFFGKLANLSGFATVKQKVAKAPNATADLM